MAHKRFSVEVLMILGCPLSLNFLVTLFKNCRLFNKSRKFSKISVIYFFEPSFRIIT